MKLLKKIEIIRLVIGVLVVTATLVWAYYRHYSVNKPLANVKSSYLVCISDNAAACSKDLVRLSCGAAISGFLQDDCLKYSLKTVSKSAGGKCGATVIEVSCL